MIQEPPPASRRRLLGQTAIALAAASAVAVLVVLPAERGIDLTGFGRLTGLVRLAKPQTARVEIAPDASAAKVYGTELATEAYRLLMEVLGTAATVRQNSPGALLRFAISMTICVHGICEPNAQAPTVSITRSLARSSTSGGMLSYFRPTANSARICAAVICPGIVCGAFI